MQPDFPPAAPSSSLIRLRLGLDLSLMERLKTIDLIRKKRDGEELSREEIAFFVRGYCRDEIPDYQAAALLMAIYLCGMSEAETSYLAGEMIASGASLDLSEIPGKKVDKHSTGGVGDKTSLIVAPVAAAAGVAVPMISGRSLGHTGGTLDKLESIPGFRTNLSSAEFRATLARAGLALIGQTDELVPADKKLYALRDVTATVESIPLICCSIMSKKLAEGIDALVLDVKAGSGAFMREEERAEELARAMVAIGRHAGKQVVALITDMNQPLGRAAGNSLEVIEAVETLKGKGPPDLVALCRELSAWMLLFGQAARDLDEGREMADELIASGAALEKFRQVVELQGGNPAALDDYDLLPRAARTCSFAAPAAGVIAELDAEKIGRAVMLLGAGRERADSEIDRSVGIVLEKKRGERVEAGEPLCTIYYNDEARLAAALELVKRAYSFSRSEPEPRPLVKKIIR